MISLLSSWHCATVRHPFSGGFVATALVAMTLIFGACSDDPPAAEEPAGDAAIGDSNPEDVAVSDATQGDTGADTSADTAGNDDAAKFDAQDAGSADAGDDAGGNDAEDTADAGCQKTDPPTEVCDDIDNDCNGKTDEDTCPAGACFGSVCGGDKGCKITFIAGSCDDGDACTGVDNCDKGVCGAGAQKDCDDGKSCTTDSCDPKTGDCSAAAVKDGQACDDGDSCTFADGCKGGVCLSGAATSCDDGNPCTTDGCDKKTGACTVANAKDGATCTDGNECTAADGCKNGVCLAGAATDCDDSNPCTADGCDAKTGKCTTAPDASGTCTDGDGCTVGDACKSGVCLPGKATTCDDDSTCTTDSCDKKTGACVFAAVKDGSECADGDKCTLSDACAGGKCASGAPRLCVDNTTCTADGCDPNTGNCTNVAVAKGTACDDGNACTHGDACDAGLCLPGALTVCDDKNVCTTDSCDTATGKCRSVPGKSGSTCDDGNACTDKDTCSLGACLPGALTICDDNDPCTADACDTKTGKCTTPAAADGSVCDDGQKCTLNDACYAGKCASGQALVCQDDNPCTADACDKATGKCVAPSEKDGTECDDGKACTLKDACESGKCASGKQRDCDDGDVCSTDSCDAASGDCRHATLVQKDGPAPLTVCGLHLWLDAKDEKTLQKDAGGSLTRWTDKSGMGHDAVQTLAGARPKVALQAQLGMPGVVFDGENDFVRLPNFVTFSNITAFVVVTARPTGRPYETLFGDYGADGNRLLAISGTTGAMARDAKSNALAIKGKLNYGKTILMLSVSDSGSIFAAANDATDTQNGTYTKGTAFDDGQPPLLGAQPLDGNANPNSGTHWAGDVHELIFFNRVLTAAEAQKVHAWLSDRWRAGIENVDGLQVWLDARDTVSITKDGGSNVSVWRDRSAHGNHAAQPAGANKPLWTNTAQFGYPGVVFDGGDDWMALPQFFDFSSATVFFAVTKRKSSQQYPTLFKDQGRNPPGNEVFAVNDYEGASARDNDGKLLSAKAPLDVGGAIRTVVLSAAGKLTIRDDGKEVTTSGTYAKDTTFETGTAPVLGASSRADQPGVFGDSHWHGDVHEMLVFDRALSSAELDFVEQWLKQRWPDPGECSAAAAAKCIDGNLCTRDVCDANTEQCSNPPEADDKGCTDGDLCTTGDGCKAGKCAAQPPKVCDDKDTCTADSCDPQSGACVFKPLNDPTGPLPKKVCGLALWLDSSDAATLQKDGKNSVSMWSDKSGHDRHAKQTSAAGQPTWAEKTPSGNPGVAFDGTSDWLGLPNFLAGDELTVFIAVTSRKPTTKYPTLLSDYGKNPPANQLLTINDGEGVSVRDNDAKALNAKWPMPLGTTVRTVVIDRVNGKLTLDVDRSAKTVTGTYAKDTAFDGGTPPMLGSASLHDNAQPNPDGFWHGDMHEVIVYDRPLSAADRNAVQQWLIERWQPAYLHPQDMQLWLDAEQDGDIVRDGKGAVSKWKDRSGHDHHAAQSGASNQPLYGDGHLGKAVHFDGKASWLTLPDLLDFPDITVFAVVTKGASLTQYPVLFADYGPNPPANKLFSINDYNGASASDNSSRVLSVKTPQVNGPAVRTIVLKGSAGQLTARTNGVGKTVTGTYETSTHFQGGQHPTIGAQSLHYTPGANTGTLWHGQLHELLIYKGALSAKHVVGIESWLASRWSPPAKCPDATLKACDDGNICTVDDCDPDTAQCKYTNAQDGAACDDGAICTENDGCKAPANGASQCAAGKMKVCDDDEACTADQCDPANGKCTFVLSAPKAGNNPQSVCGLELWLDAADATKITKGAGDKVGKWADKGPGGHDATQAKTAAQPVFTAKTASGKPGITFDGKATWMGLAEFTKSPNVTVFMAVSRRQSTTKYPTLLHNYGEPNSRLFFVSDYEGVTVRDAASKVLSIKKALPPGPALESLELDAAQGKLTARHNEQVTTVSGPFAANTHFDGGPAPMLGAGSLADKPEPNGDTYWTGDVHEVVVYRRVLTAQEKALVWGYLDAKWNQPMPHRIAGLELWLDGSDDKSFIKDANGAVARWNDKSGKDRHAQQASAAVRPTWAAKTANGRPGVTFDGANDWLTMPNFHSFHDTTMFFVVTNRASNKKYPSLWSDYGPNPPANRLLYLGNAQGAVARDASAQALNANAPLPIGSSIRSITLNAAAGKLTVTTNGKAKTVTGAYAKQTSFEGGQPPILGAASLHDQAAPNSDSYWSGDVHEVLVFNRALTQAEHDAVAKWLTERWVGKTGCDADKDCSDGVACTWDVCNDNQCSNVLLDGCSEQAQSCTYDKGRADGWSCIEQHYPSECKPQSAGGTAVLGTGCDSDWTARCVMFGGAWQLYKTTKSGQLAIFKDYCESAVGLNGTFELSAP